MKALYIILAMALTSCGAQNMKEISKTIDVSQSSQAYAQAWTGGAPGSGSGVTLYFPTSVTTGYEVAAVYFREHISKSVNYTADDRMTMVTRFRTDFNGKKDIVMDLDSKKEAPNEAPNLEKFPFELNKDEAVIALKKTHSDKITYVKLTNIEERSQLMLPSMPQ